MAHFVPYEKLSKKDQKQFNAAKRKDWGILSPVTRVVPNKKNTIVKKQKWSCFRPKTPPYWMAFSFFE